MTWARFDDGFCQHPKVIGLSDGAFRLHVAAVCYAARNLTDGYVPAAALATLKRNPQRAATELAAAGLWDEAEGGYAIHDYLDYNPSHTEVNSKRASKAMAGAKGAASRWHSGPNAPVPVPVPVPSLAAAAAAAPGDDVQRCVRAYDGLMGQPACTPPVLARIQQWVQISTTANRGEWFEAACEEAALSNVRKLNYVLSILERWEREGRHPKQKPPEGDPDIAAAAASLRRNA